MSQILNRADPISGAALSLISKTLMRHETTGNHKGTDGLKMSDLRDTVTRKWRNVKTAKEEGTS